MSSAADRIREKNNRINTAAAAGNPPSGAARPVRTAPVRITVDLPPAAHAALLAWCAQTAGELGRARVPHTAVLRALVDQLTEDPALAETIRTRLDTSQSAPQ